MSMRVPLPYGIAALRLPVRSLGIFAALIAANLAAWAWAYSLFSDRPAVLGTALLAWVFGLRHAVDADHIAAIDNVVRKLMHQGQQPRMAGLFFSLGHSTVVVAAAILLALMATTMKDEFIAFKSIGGVIDAMGRVGRRPALLQSGVAKPPTQERKMPKASAKPETPTAIHSNLTAIFVSLELSQKVWLVTSLSPGSGEKISKHSVPAGDVSALLLRFAELTNKAKARTGKTFQIVCIQEAGLDGFWLHRLLVSEGVESHVVDPASITTSRRHRRAKTDRLDGEALLRALMAFKRGEPRVCAMAVPPSAEEEDDRRLGRERKTLLVERVQHSNRIKGLLFSQGISDYKPLDKDRRQRLDELTTGDGRPLPIHFKTQIGRELDRLELLLGQIKAVEAERDALLEAERAEAQKTSEPKDDQRSDSPPPSAPRMLLDLKGIGPEFAFVLWHEGLYRHFDNRRQLASYAGLTPTPWQSGSIDREQGVSKAGNRRLRHAMIELAWLWLYNQPQSAPSRWFKQRVEANGGRGKKTAIVAMARKLLVALWKYVTAGVVIEGAVMKIA